MHGYNANDWRVALHAKLDDEQNIQQQQRYSKLLLKFILLLFINLRLLIYAPYSIENLI